MAREYAQIRLRIWNDDDFLDLEPAEQHLYFVLLTSPELSAAGVTDWRPKRIAAKARGWDVEMVEEAAAGLVEKLYIVVDEDTEEVLIRSFIRHDGIIKQPKMAAAMASAHAAIASRSLRGIVIHELRRLHNDAPDAKGWGAAQALELLDRRTVDPSTYPCRKGSIKGSVKGSDSGSVEGSVNAEPTPNSTGTVKGSPSPVPKPSPTAIIHKPSESLRSSGDADASPDAAPADDWEQDSLIAEPETKRQPKPPKAPTEPDPAGDVARALYDHANGLIKFVAIRQLAERALKRPGVTPERVIAAMKAIYDDGRPITLQGVGQCLAGLLPGQRRTDLPPTGTSPWDRTR